MVYLEDIKPNPDQIAILYDLLDHRKHAISHRNKPSFSDHQAFVLSHPYRSWLLIRDEQTCIGSVYLQQDNSIGINMIDDRQVEFLTQVIALITDRFDPLPAITSVRPNWFSINVMPGNRAMIDVLEKCGYRVAQLVYAL